MFGRWDNPEPSAAGLVHEPQLKIATAFWLHFGVMCRRRADIVPGK
jgi:hypothetical protein